MPRPLTEADLVGRKINRLTVTGIAGRPAGGVRVSTLCECGREGEAQWQDIRCNRTKSCGCLNREVRANNLTGGRRPIAYTHGIWTPEHELAAAGVPASALDLARRSWR